MKKFLLSMIAIFAMTICGFAQMPVCADACAPHANDADYSTGVIPTYPTAFAPLTVGVPVDECISIKIPNQISGSAISSILSAVTISVNSVNVNGLVGLPDGLEACASANPMAANGTYTLRITGTPTTAGDYPLNMRAEIDGESNFPLISMSTVNSYVNGTNGVSTNITITVVEAGEMAANFSTNPSATGMLTQAVHINEGETVTFTDLSTGADHIAWSFEGGSPATSTDATVTVTYATAGTYTATITAYNADESQNATKSVSIEVSGVELSASFTTDPAYTDLYVYRTLSVERGTTVTYTDASTGADHIAWAFEGGSPATSTESVVAVTYNTAGSYTTTLTAYNEDESNSSEFTLTVTVTVSGEEAVTADFTTDPEATDVYITTYISINQGETVTFTNASSENTDHIAWTFDGGSPATSTENVVTVTYAEAGNFTATLTAYNDDETISDSKSVTVMVTSVDPNAVEASFTTNPEYTDLYVYRMLAIETGTTVTYTSTCNENTDHIAWSFEGGNPTSSTDGVVNVTYTTAGSYTTTLTAYSADESSSDEFTLTVTVTDPVAVEENAISEISVYPNPTSSVINIAAEGMQNITIIDMTGRVVMSKDVNSNFETIDAEGFAKANYMVRIATADGVVVKNIVVE